MNKVWRHFGKKSAARRVVVPAAKKGRLNNLLTRMKTLPMSDLRPGHAEYGGLQQSFMSRT
jgi:hypothetical protein